MNIDELKIGEVKQLVALFGAPASQGLNNMIGQKVIIRTFSAGNFFGVLEAKSGDEIYLTNARRMWYWKAAQGISLSACALHGIDHEVSRIVAPVERIWLQAIEIIPCTPTAIKVWKERPMPKLDNLIDKGEGYGAGGDYDYGSGDGAGSGFDSGSGDGAGSGSGYGNGYGGGG